MAASSSSSSTPLSILVLQHSSSPKLKGISMLLDGVVAKARTVVKGTDSHKRFNLQYGDFCRTALTGVVQLEDEMNARLVSYLQNVAGGDGEQTEGSSLGSPASKAKDAADHAAIRAAFAEFCKGHAQRSHAKHHRGSIGLEEIPPHVSLSDAVFLSDVATYVSKECKQTLTKIFLEHLGSTSISASQAAERLARDKAVPGKKRTRGGDAVAAAGSDSNSTMSMMEPPLSPLQQATSASPSLRPTPLVIPPSSSSSKGSPALRPSGGGNSGGHHPHPVPHAMKRLSDNPALAPLMQPWTIAQPYAFGIALDRMSANDRSTPFHHHHQTGAPTSPPTVLDLCAATSASDLLRMWEEREAMLNAAGSDAAAGAGESPVALRPLSTTGGGGNTMNVGEGGGGGVVDEGLPFFPSPLVAAHRYCDAIPRSFLVHLVHCGVSSIEVAKL